MLNNLDLNNIALKGRFIYSMYDLEKQSEEFHNFLKYIGLCLYIFHMKNIKFSQAE